MTRIAPRLLAVAGIIFATCFSVPPSARGQVLFDNTKSESVANANWIIDTSQPIPSPTITNITSSTPESYWTGALSSWGVALAKLRNSGQISLPGNGLETLPTSGSITYGNASNSQDLSHYQVYIVCEPNIRFTDAEKTAILNFVKNGGGLFMVADHNGSDRNNDGIDSLAVWNDLMYTNSVQTNPFGFRFNADDVSPSANADSSSSDPLTHGIAGTVTTLVYSSGTTMTINNTTTTHAAVWSTSSTTSVMALYGTYGAGRFAAIGDSSVVEDATSSSGQTYAGWTTPVDNGYCAINGTVWLLGGGSPIAPTVTTGSASSVTTTTGVLNGTINPNGQSTTALFQYGLTTSYSSTAPVSGTFTGTTAQAVSASITGLAPGTTYHFRVAATNATGATSGLDQTFATATVAVPDLAITATHNGNFTQGDTGDVYTITVTNVGGAASSGTVTVVDTLPTGLTPTAISGSGWTTTLATLTCTRTDALPAGSGYPAITVTVNVAANAPASVSNTATVSGGGDTNLANNSASDTTTISSISSGGGGATNVVISQFYGPGGNSSGVTYKNDFVELFNPGSTAVNLSTWSVQYASATGSSWQVTDLNGSLQPYHYYLVQLSSGGTYGAALPTADATGTINISATSGKLALVSSQTALTGSNPIGSSQVVDFVGYGTANAFEGSAAAPGGGDTTSTLRKDGGYADSTNNATDFTTLTPPTPRNSASPANPPPPAPLPDFAISLAHAGNFTQGDPGDSYRIAVTNIGTAATAGTVSVVDTLPAGLTATAISGDGWTPNLSTLSCTRSDTLAVGAGYPPITVTVTVSAGAPASVTNVATVSGGGDVSPANNTASDPTTILAASAPVAITGTASGVGTSTTTLNGSVNPNGQAATAQFQYGLTASYGSILPVSGSLSGTTTQAVSAPLLGLLSGTTYHFRVAATNVLGATTGQDQVFTTLAPIEAWRQQWFGTTANSGPAADNAVATSDGMPNLLKYALGLNPLVATNDPVAGDISTGYLRLTVPKNPEATDVTFHVEAASDVTTASWTTNGTTVDLNTATLLQAHYNTPVASSEGAFIRLRVSRP